MAKSDCVVIIPMYNERENAAAIIDAVMGLEHGFDVLVIDDNSPDGTAAIVKDKMAQYPGRVMITERAGKLGLGTAYIEGFKRALAEGYDYVFEMDADFSHNPEDLERLRKACAEEGADVAVGSRYVTGVNVVNWPMGRVLMSYYASKYVRLVTGLPGRHQVQGLCLPDRDEVYGPSDGLQGGRGAHRVREPRAGHVEDEFIDIRRGRVRRDTAEMEQPVLAQAPEIALLK